MNTVLKVEYDGDLRRALLKGTPSYSDIDRAIKEIWPGHGADGAKYMDEEGDACTLKEKTFPDFLATAQKSTTGDVLRLKLPDTAANQEVPDSAEAPSATEAFTRPWERVEQGSEAGEEHLHTVADLTDNAQEEPEPDHKCTEEIPAAAAPVDVEAEQEPETHQKCTEEVPAAAAPADVKAEQDDGAAAEGRARTQSHSISTPPSSPRGSGFCELPENAPVHGYPTGEAESSSSACPPAPDLIIDHEMDEKIDIILAAFDENGDSHLNFAESSALHIASDGPVSFEAFQQMCVSEGEDPQVGLGRESLMCIYSRCSTLERDFTAAKAKLEAVTPDERAERRRRREEASAHPVGLMLKNPLLAVPFAEGSLASLKQKAGAMVFGKR